MDWKFCFHLHRSRSILDHLPFTPADPVCVRAERLSHATFVRMGQDHLLSDTESVVPPTFRYFAFQTARLFCYQRVLEPILPRQTTWFRMGSQPTASSARSPEPSNGVESRQDGLLRKGPRFRLRGWQAARQRIVSHCLPKDDLIARWDTRFHKSGLRVCLALQVSQL